MVTVGDNDPYNSTGPSFVYRGYVAHTAEGRFLLNHRQLNTVTVLCVTAMMKFAIISARPCANEVAGKT
jgi:hypothetical protein